MALNGSMAGKPCRRGKRLDPPLDRFKLKLLKRLAVRASERRVRLMFVTAPLLLACSVDRRPLFERFAKIARGWGVPYRSFIIATQAPTDLYDQNHLNRAAALRYSGWIADALAALPARGIRGK